MLGLKLCVQEGEAMPGIFADPKYGGRRDVMIYLEMIRVPVLYSGGFDTSSNTGCFDRQNLSTLLIATSPFQKVRRELPLAALDVVASVRVFCDVGVRGGGGRRVRRGVHGEEERAGGDRDVAPLGGEGVRGRDRTGAARHARDVPGGDGRSGKGQVVITYLIIRVPLSMICRAGQDEENQWFLYSPCSLVSIALS